MKTAKYARKPFEIDAVQVTAENLEEVAAWCEGEIIGVDGEMEKSVEERYIKVHVHRPMNEKQTKAFVGDWVLYAGKGFKVYTNKAFEASFELVVAPKADKAPQFVESAV